MGSPTTIHPFPELRALAEEEARDIWTRHVRLFRERLPDMEVVADPHDASDGFAVTVDAQVERLCDLTRPASRDAVARLVAKRLGLNFGTTAPAFWIRDAEPPARWVLDGAWDDREFTYERPRGYVPPEPGGWLLVPSLAGVTDPAESLALIVRHLWPEESTDAR